MVSETLVRQLPALKRRLSAALQAASLAPNTQIDAVDELAVAVEELEVATDALAEAQEQLRLERQRYRELFEEAPDGYLVVDTHGVIHDANRAAAAMLQVRPATLVGKPLAVYVSLCGGGDLHQCLQALMTRDGRPTTEWEAMVRPRVTPRFPAWIRARAAPGASGGADSVRLLLRDVSDRMRAEQRERDERSREAAKLRADADRLESLDHLKSDFLNLASHELRAPLAVIRGHVSMLADGSLGAMDERARDVLPVVTAKCDQMARLVDEILETARLDDSGKHLVRRRLDLADIAAAVAGAMVPTAEIAGRQLRLRRADHPLPVYVDRDRIATVVTNILDNAVKYSNPGSVVECLVDGDGSTATVAVRDHGPGIPPDQMDHLFTRFGRIVNRDTAHIGGIGLGLYLCRELARMHGGDLRAETVPGAGSTFTLSLPLHHDSATRARRS